MARSSGKKTTTPGAHPAILERNLERYPWARLSDDKGEQLILGALMNAAGEEGRAWMVTPDESDRLPGPFDADLYVALCQLYNAAGRPDGRTVETSLTHLAELMHRPPGGGWYDAVEDSLRRLLRTTITAVRTWREGDFIADEKIFHLIASVEFGIRRDRDEGGTRVRVRFSDEIAESIAAGNFRLLNTADYFALHGPTAKRLYRYLDYRRWRGVERMNEVSFSLKMLATELPIDREAPSHIKRTLDPAHEELVRQGFLSAADYQEHPVPGKKRPEIWVRYRFPPPGASLPPTAERAPAPVSDGEYVRDIVAEMLNLLKDDHSTAFYVKVARTLSEEQLRGVIGYVRESIRDGADLELARKVFTTTAKARAKSAGLDL